MKVEIKITVDYDDDTIHLPSMLVADLYDYMHEAIGNGILSGPDHDLIVGEYTLNVRPPETEENYVLVGTEQEAFDAGYIAANSGWIDSYAAWLDYLNDGG